jgi:translocon-associated protein subunit beta
MARTPTDWRNLAIVLFVVGSAVGINSVVKGASTARTNQRRKKALESLEKEQ